MSPNSLASILILGNDYDDFILYPDGTGNYLNTQLLNQFRTSKHDPFPDFEWTEHPSDKLLVRTKAREWGTIAAIRTHTQMLIVDEHAFRVLVHRYANLTKKGDNRHD